MLCPPGPVVMNQLLFKSMPATRRMGADLGADQRSLRAVGSQGLRGHRCEVRAENEIEPEKITYASPGVGTTGHLAVKQLENRAGIRLVTVPYAGLRPPSRTSSAATSTCCSNG